MILKALKLYTVYMDIYNIYTYRILRCCAGEVDLQSNNNVQPYILQYMQNIEK